MARPKTNYLIDALMVVSFLFVAVTGVILFLFFPSGIKQGAYQTFFGITKKTLLFIHNWGGILLGILILIHIFIHLNWFIYMTKNLFKK